MITLVRRFFFMPIIFVAERIHNDLEVADEVPTHVKCIIMKKTTLALCPNLSKLVQPLCHHY